MKEWQRIDHHDAGTSWICSEPATLNIVFVHGFRGDHMKTWSWESGRKYKLLGKRESVSLFDLLCKDDELPRCNYFSIGHSADIGQLTGIDNAATLIKTFLSNFVYCHNAPIALIAHSFGGLACRRAILLLLEQETVSIPVISLLLMGTPNNGTELGRVARALGSKAGADMRPFDEKILRLNQQWSSRVINGGDPCIDPEIRDPLLCWTVVGTKDRVVPEASGASLASFSTVRTIDRDHTGLVKARDFNDPTYTTIAQFIAATMEEIPRREIEHASRRLTYRLKKATLTRPWLYEESESYRLTDTDDDNVFNCVVRNIRKGAPARRELTLAVWFSGYKPSGDKYFGLKVGRGLMTQNNFDHLTKNIDSDFKKFFKVESFNVVQDGRAGIYEYDKTETGPNHVLMHFRAPDWLEENSRNTQVELQIKSLVDRRQGYMAHTVGHTILNRLELTFQLPFEFSQISRLGLRAQLFAPSPIGGGYSSRAVVEGPVQIGSALFWVFQPQDQPIV